MEIVKTFGTRTTLESVIHTITIIYIRMPRTWKTDKSQIKRDMQMLQLILATSTLYSRFLGIGLAHIMWEIILRIYYPSKPARLY